MKYLLDTCIISEMIKDPVDDHLITWLSTIHESQLSLSVVTIGEIQKGIHRLAPGKKRTLLHHWLFNDLMTRFNGRIHLIDEETAVAWGSLLADCEIKGMPMPAIDALIAATAMIKKAIVVTRNEADFEACGIPLYNPWTPA